MDYPSVEYMFQELVKIGLITNAPDKNALEAAEFKRLVILIAKCFYPHGMGHFLGLTTHDVGFSRLGSDGTWGRNEMMYTVDGFKRGMVLTVEPGCYFNRDLIESKKTSEVGKYLNYEMIEEWYPVGGVRIEDNVVVTEDGFEFLGQCPRTVEEIESAMASP